MPGIFISYRHGPTSAHAGRLYDRLASEFGDDSVFMDLTAIDPGADFAERIEHAVGEADALLVVIGPDWVEARDGDGRSRLDDPDDFVRREVIGALERDTLVVPVLVDGAVMPDGRSLPEPLRSLERRHALELTNVGWSRDVDRLVQTLRERIGGPDLQLQQRSRRRTFIALALCLLAAGVAGVVLAATREGDKEPGRSSSVKKAAEVSVGGFPFYTAATEDKVWVVSRNEGLLKSFRPQSQQVSDSPVGQDLGGLTSVNGRLFVGDYGRSEDDGRGRILEVNPANGRPIGRPWRSIDPFEIATDGRSLWVTDSETVQAIDLKTRTTRTVGVFKGSVYGLAVSQGKAWVTDNGRGRLHSFNAQSGRELGHPVDVGTSPFGLAVGGGFVWVALDGGNLVRVPVDGGARRLLTVGGEGRHMVIANDRSVWVVDQFGVVVLVDARSFKIRARLFLKGDLQDVALAAGGGAWIARGRSTSTTPSSVVRLVYTPPT